jgi:ribonuclease R
MLDNTCEGLISLSQMKNRYWYDPESMTLSCGKNIYRLGQSVRIKVERVDIATQKVDFSLVDEPLYAFDDVFGKNKRHV